MKQKTPEITKETDNPKTDKLLESMDFLRKGKSLLRHSVDARKRYDYEWMVRDLFRRGYMFSKYQPTTNTIVLASKQNAQIPINLTAIWMRSICNQVTSFRPKWEMMPDGLSKEAKVQARYKQVLLDHIYKTEHLKTKIKETVKQGLMFSVGGPWQVVYDKETNQIKIWHRDTWDFFWDMFSDTMEDCQYQIIAVRRPVDEVQKNPDFDAEARMEIRGGEERLAVSENKQFLVQSMRQLPAVKEEEYESVLLFEGYFKTRNDKGEVDIRKMVWTDQNSKPLIDEMQGQDFFDFVLYRADLNPREILGEGWMKHVMPINRVINLAESSVFDYMTRVAKGRILVDKDSGVNAIHTTHGEVISKNRGAEVRMLEMPNLPHSVNLFIDRMHRYGEDLSGVHDSTLGRMPTGIRSGIGLNELKQGDATSQDDLVDNLEDFLEEVANKIFKKISKHQKTYQVIHDLGFRDSEAKAFAVVGEHAGKKGSTIPGHEGQVKIGPDWFDLAVIGDDNNARVTIGSWLGYTKEAAQEKALNLANAGIIDQKEVLNIFEFGDVDDLIRRTRVEKLLNKNLGQPSQPGQPGQVDDYDLAMTENEMIMNENKDMPVKESDDHMVHIAIHQEVMGQGEDELLLKHIGMHQFYLGMGPTEVKPDKQTQEPQAPQTPPQGPPAGPQMPPMAPPQPQGPPMPPQGPPAQGLPMGQ